MNENLKKLPETAETKEQEGFLIPLKSEKRKLFKDYCNLYSDLMNVKESAFNTKKMLGELVIEGDLVIFFGTSNTGKSLFTYQLSEAIATGKKFFDITDELGIESNEVDQFRLVNETEPQKVIYADFESTREKVYRRYSDKESHILYPFSENIITIFPEARTVANKLLYIDSIETVIKETDAKFLIIDNLSAISFKSEESDFAANVMNRLKDFQDKYGLTIVVVAHTPKGKKNKIITMDDLQGSANFANLADAIFAIGSSEDGSSRYIKQLKSRINEVQYDTENVIVLRIKNLINNFVGFDFVGYSTENVLIKNVGEDEKSAEKLCVIEKVKAGKNAREIASELFDRFGNGKNMETYYQKIKKMIQRLKKSEVEIVEDELPI